MPVTRPCIVGRMGSTTYYETTMTGRELQGQVRPAKHSDEWASQGIEERMQREFDIKRIKETIVPYLAQHPDRFFGSLVVIVPAGSIEFEPLDAIITDRLPAAYRESAQKIGFLTVGEGELIALDGQHRLLAFKEVIAGGPPLGEFASQVGDDEVCVLFIENEDRRKTRRIFNKINRHAKPTGRSDNIVTSEDDGNAIVTRRLLDADRNAPLADVTREGGEVRELVNWKSNTLGQNSLHLTTISALYETVKVILEFKGFKDFDERHGQVPPSEEVLDRAYEVAAECWETILTMDAFRNAMAAPGSVPATRYDPENRHSLVLRPVGQQVLVAGMVMAMKRSNGELGLPEAVRRANLVDWSCTETSMWMNTIVRAGERGQRMVARREMLDVASELVAYLIGDEYMDERLRHDLWQRWNALRGRDVKTPVDQIGDDHLIPQDLPAPVQF